MTTGPGVLETGPLRELSVAPTNPSCDLQRPGVLWVRSFFGYQSSFFGWHHSQGCVLQCDKDSECVIVCSVWVCSEIGPCVGARRSSPNPSCDLLHSGVLWLRSFFGYQSSFFGRHLGQAPPPLTVIVSCMDVQQLVRMIRMVSCPWMARFDARAKAVERSMREIGRKYGGK